MQIICNNCGHELEFPNRQVYVTCPHCYTHLQIEEHDNRIFATIIEAPDIDHSIFQKQELSTINLPNAFYDLLHLEGEYDNILEETAFYSLSQRTKNRPSLFRAFFRFLLFGLASFWFLNGLAFYLKNGGDYSNLFFGFLFLAYAIAILIIGIKEFRKGIELYRFEKFYTKEKQHLLTILEDENLPSSYRQNLNELATNYEQLQEIIQEFFYIKLFNQLNIKIGAPTISYSLRLFIIGIPTLLIALGIGLRGYNFSFLFAAIAVVALFFGFFILGDSSEYKRISQLNITKRTAILDKLQKLMR